MNESLPWQAFWATFAGGSVVALLIISAPLIRGAVGRIPGITARDFPQCRDSAHPLKDPRIVAAVRDAFSGWRAVLPAIVFGLIMAAGFAAWEMALPSSMRGRSAWSVGVRAGVSVPLSFWLTSRMIVASIHRHLTEGGRERE
jgi:hypothetical protein